MTGERKREKASPHIHLTFRALLSREFSRLPKMFSQARFKKKKNCNTGIFEIGIFWLFLFLPHKY